MDMSAVIENRILSSSIRDLSVPDVDLGTLLKEAFETFKDRTAIVSRNLCSPTP